jgi:hypothetical protein
MVVQQADEFDSRVARGTYDGHPNGSGRL